MGEEKHAWLEAVYNARNAEELARGYDDWAEAYDKDLMGYGYRLPAIAAGLLARHVSDLDGPILDAGCGTGLVGEAVHVLGYNHIEGLDFSEQMLAVAHRKSIYRGLHKARLGDRLEFPDNHFSGIYSMGTFTVGHAGPEGFDELIRIARKGAPLIISLRSDGEAGDAHRARMLDLVEAGLWRQVDASREVVTMPWEDATVRNVVYVLVKR